MLGVSLGKIICGYFNVLFGSFWMSALMSRLWYPAAVVILIYVIFFHVFFYLFMFLISCSKNSSQKHFLDLRKIKNINSVFDVYFNAKKQRLNCGWCSFERNGNTRIDKLYQEVCSIIWNNDIIWKELFCLASVHYIIYVTLQSPIKCEPVPGMYSLGGLESVITNTC